MGGDVEHFFLQSAKIILKFADIQRALSFYATGCSSGIYSNQRACRGRSRLPWRGWCREFAEISPSC